MEVLRGETIRVEVKGVGDTNLQPLSFERKPEIQTLRQGFSMAPLSNFLLQQVSAHRERGFLAFELKWETLLEGRVTAEGKSRFMVVYQPPSSPDPYRNQANVDLVSGRPAFSTSDAELSSVDGRLNLSSSRIFDPRQPFHSGVYGSGFSDGQLLQVRLSAYWNLQAAAENFDIRHFRPLLAIEHPGQFSLQMLVCF